MRFYIIENYNHVSRYDESWPPFKLAVVGEGGRKLYWCVTKRVNEARVCNEFDPELRTLLECVVSPSTSPPSVWFFPSLCATTFSLPSHYKFPKWNELVPSFVIPFSQPCQQILEVLCMASSIPSSSVNLGSAQMTVYCPFLDKYLYHLILFLYRVALEVESEGCTTDLASSRLYSIVA